MRTTGATGPHGAAEPHGAVGSSRRRAARVAAVATVLTLLLSACSAAETPSPTPSGAPVITPDEIPAEAPQFVPDGTAEQNRAFFDYVVSRHIVDGGGLGRADFIGVLTGAGWVAELIEATADATPLGNAADAVTFAVQAGEECLVGQWNGEYSSVIAPRLASGTCLVGTAHPAG